LLLLVTLPSLAPAAVLLQNNAEPAPKDAAPRPEPNWNRKVAAVGAAAQIAAVGDPWTVLAMRGGGLHNLIWKEHEVERVPTLNAELLQSVEDKKPMPDFRGKAPDEISKREMDEYEVYCQALVNARDTSPELFAREAREDDNRAITWGHLFREPGLYRGKVIHMAGRLKRIVRETAPQLAQRQGVKHVYEGWVFTERVKSNPVCVIFTQLPEGLHEAESMDQNVTFDGYFFKEYLYVSGAGRRYTLLFVAPTLNVTGPIRGPEDVASGLPMYVFYVIGGLAAGTIVLLIGLSVWFRRSDQQLRRRLAELQAKRGGELGFALDDDYNTRHKDLLS